MSAPVPPLSDDEIRALRSILKGISVDEWRVLKAIAHGVVASGSAGNGAGGGSASKPAAAADLDGPWGNPTVRKNPKRWAGDPYVGARYSECPTDFLVVLAEYLEWCADKDRKKPEPKKHTNGTPYWQFDLNNAARARGWALRNRGKTMPPPAPADDDGGTPEDSPSSDDFDQDASGGADEEWTPT